MRRLTGVEEGGDEVALGGWDRRSVSIFEMASARVPASGVAETAEVKGFIWGDLLGDLPGDLDSGDLAVGERASGDFVTGALDGLAEGTGGGGMDMVMRVDELDELWIKIVIDSVMRWGNLLNDVGM